MKYIILGVLLLFYYFLGVTYVNIVFKKLIFTQFLTLIMEKPYVCDLFQE